MLVFFSTITYQILKRRKERLNLIFSGFFISIIIGNLLNMIYAAIPYTPPNTNKNIILTLNFLANFFFLFGPIFILTVNRIILESTIIFSIKRQNSSILIYGTILFSGMLILVLLPDPFNILGVDLTDEGAPIYKPLFFTYVILFSAAFVVIPVIRSSLKIYTSFETVALKKKWFYYFIGSLGSFGIFYFIFIGNFMNYFSFDTTIFRLIINIYTSSVILWVLLMYYGIGFKLKQ